MALNPTQVAFADASGNVGAVTGSNPLPVALTATPTIDLGDVQVIPSQGSFTSRSGAIAAGGTSETLAAANTSRKFLMIQNPATLTGQNIAAAESLFIRFGASAAGVNNGTSFEILPGGALTLEASFVSTEAVQVNAATTAHKWIAVEG